MIRSYGIPGRFVAANGAADKVSFVKRDLVRHAGRAERTEALAPAAQPVPPARASPGGLGMIYGDEMHFVPRPDMRQSRQVSADDSRDLGITARGLAIGHQNDGLAIGRNAWIEPGATPSETISAPDRYGSVLAVEAYAHAVHVAGDAIGVPRKAASASKVK